MQTPNLPQYPVRPPINWAAVTLKILAWAVLAVAFFKWQSNIHQPDYIIDNTILKVGRDTEELQEKVDTLTDQVNELVYTTEQIRAKVAPADENTTIETTENLDTP